MLHGSGPGATGWSNFAAQVEHLSDRFRVIAVDMPGWGKSDPVTYEERDHRKAAIDFLDELGIEKAAFVGNSMGGGTSLKVAACHPDRVTHLITLGSGAAGVKLFGAGDGPTEGLKLLQAAYRDAGIEQMQKFIDIFCYDAKFRTPELAKQRSDNALAHPEHLKNFVDGIGKPRRGSATEEEIAGITAPTLLIHGRDDRVVHYENSLRLVSLIPNSRLVLLNRCGHWAQVEHADEFNRLLGDFLTNA
ncbi:MAG: alpha/beta fold hydrolase [Nocardioides sp.]|nr:alpha/beta fold hydrolase [Nocardioides sp.]